MVILIGKSYNSFIWVQVGAIRESPLNSDMVCGEFISARLVI